jgi:hypothetical protein
MIHNGLQINLKRLSGEISINHCCLRSDQHNTTIDNIWNNPSLIPLRKLNLENKWDPGCECRGNETAGFDSLRTGTLKMFGKNFASLPGSRAQNFILALSAVRAAALSTTGPTAFFKKLGFAYKPRLENVIVKHASR